MNLKSKKSGLIGSMILLVLSLFVMATPVIYADDSGSVASFSKGLEDTTPFGFEEGMAIDYDTGQVLYEKNADQLHGIASMTKLVSLYIVYDKLASGEIQLDQKVPISNVVATASRSTELSNVPLEASTDRYTVDALLNAVIIESANSAMEALAELIAGNEDNFIQLMNEKVTSLGITDYRFYTVSGLNASRRQDATEKGYNDTQQNEMSARELLYLTQSLIKKYPDIQKRSQVTEQSFQVSDTETYTLKTTNEFLPGMPYARKDVFGLKTGTESLAGACIIIMTEIDGRSVLLITMGAKDNTARFQETGRLLDTLQSKLKWRTVRQDGQLFSEKDAVSVYLGTEDKTTLIYGSNVQLFLPVDYNLSANSSVLYQNSFAYDTSGNLRINAPVTAGETLNKELITIKFYETVGKENQTLSVPITTESNIEQLNFFVRVSRYTKEIVKNVSERIHVAFQEMMDRFRDIIKEK